MGSALSSLQHPLCYACQLGDTDTLKKTLKSYKDREQDLAHDLNKKHGVFGYTPLHYACAHGHDNVVKELLREDGFLQKKFEQLKIQVNLVCPSNQTPLHKAALHSHVRCVMALCANAGDTLNAFIEDNQHKTAANLAESCFPQKSAELCYLIIKAFELRQRLQEATLPKESTTSTKVLKSLIWVIKSKLFVLRNRIKKRDKKNAATPQREEDTPDKVPEQTDEQQQEQALRIGSDSHNVEAEADEALSRDQEHDRQGQTAHAPTTDRAKSDEEQLDDDVVRVVEELISLSLDKTYDLGLSDLLLHLMQIDVNPDILRKFISKNLLKKIHPESCDHIPSDTQSRTAEQQQMLAVTIICYAVCVGDVKLLTYLLGPQVEPPKGLSGTFACCKCLEVFRALLWADAVGSEWRDQCTNVAIHVAIARAMLFKNLPNGSEQCSRRLTVAAVLMWLLQKAHRKYAESVFLDWSRLQLSDDVLPALSRTTDHFPHLLDKVKEVSFRQNPITSVPGVLLKMKNLQRLDLSSCLLSRSLEVDKQCNVKEISIMSSIFCDLEQLEDLYLSDCGLTNLDFVCMVSHQLKRLDLSNNYLASLPDVFGNSQLQELNLASNQLKQVPECVKRMRSLSKLQLSNNREIPDLPEELGFLSDLTKLEVNGLERLPESFVSWSHNIPVLRQVLKKKLFRRKPQIVRKTVVLGDPVELCREVTERLRSVMTDMATLNLGTVRSYRMCQDVFDSGFSHYVLAFHANDYTKEKVESCLLEIKHAKAGRQKGITLLVLWGEDGREAETKADEVRRQIRQMVVSGGNGGNTAGGGTAGEGMSQPASIFANSRPQGKLDTADWEAVQVHPLTNSVRMIKHLTSRLKEEPAVRIDVAEDHAAVCQELRTLRVNQSLLPLVMSETAFSKRVKKAEYSGKSKLGPIVEEWRERLYNEYLLQCGEALQISCASSTLCCPVITDASRLTDHLVLFSSRSCPYAASLYMDRQPPILQREKFLESQGKNLEVAMQLGEQLGIVYSLEFEQKPPLLFLPLLCPEQPEPSVQEAIKMVPFHRICVFPEKIADIKEVLWHRYTAFLLKMLKVPMVPVAGSASDCTPFLHMPEALRAKWTLSCWSSGIAVLRAGELYCSAVCVAAGFPLADKAGPPKVLLSVGEMPNEQRAHFLGSAVDMLQRLVCEYTEQSPKDEYMSHFVICSDCIDAGTNGYLANAKKLIQQHLGKHQKEHKCEKHPGRVTDIMAIIPDLVLDDFPDLPKERISSFKFGPQGQVAEPEDSTKTGHCEWVDHEPKDVFQKTFKHESIPVAGILDLRWEVSVLLTLKECNFVVQCRAVCLDESLNVRLVMDYLGGLSLSDYLLEVDSGTRKPLCRLVSHRIGLQMSSALAFMHGKGILHRDVKPSNVMIVDETSSAKVNIKFIDLGSAIMNMPGLPQRKEGTMVYLPPELYRERRKELKDVLPRYNSQRDVFSFGLTLAELIACCSLTKGEKANKQERNAGLQPGFSRRRKVLEKAQRYMFGQRAGVEVVTMAVLDEPQLRPASKEITRFLAEIDAHLLMDEKHLDCQGDITAVATCHALNEASGAVFLVVFATSMTDAHTSSLLVVEMDAGKMCLSPTLSKDFSFHIHCMCMLKDHVYVCASSGPPSNPRHMLKTFLYCNNQLNEDKQGVLQGDLEQQPTSLASDSEYLLVGCADGQVKRVPLASNATMTWADSPTVRDADGNSIQQILVVEPGCLWCVVEQATGESQSKECVVEQITLPPPDNGSRDVDLRDDQQGQAGARTAVQGVKKLALAANFVWGWSGTKLFCWRKSDGCWKMELEGKKISDDFHDCLAEHVEHFEQVQLEHQAGREGQAQDQSAYDIMDACAVNNVLWVAIRLGAIFLYTADLPIEKLDLLHGHCCDVQRLIPVRLPGEADSVISYGFSPAALLSERSSLRLRSSAEYYAAERQAQLGNSAEEDQAEARRGSEGATGHCYHKSMTAVAWDARWSPNMIKTIRATSIEAKL